ncbi:hypothetical protein [Pseudoleptotrichia goodfellowii]|jgi:hypothetical protein|uniref:Lipoprotein n=1 Tax=Pseudoleptotrichia goodfellowii F0264 TaxID=596323 RepID=D0GN58_9FUSO|nr:hypothetical protein [Pseudoleptotrichia goodfellowii]EEY34465.1 hypothetical protein HMPREF0554_1850 [Pseudoleptotrichia goodfellowii F0264]
MSRMVKVLVIMALMMSLFSCNSALRCELGSRTACIDYGNGLK